MVRGSSRLVPALAALLLAACASPSGQVYQPGPKATMGALGGAAAGGLLGAAISGEPEAIAAGVILGGLLGGAVGDALDANDRRYAAETAYRSFEYSRTGRSSTWRNPDSGHSGSVTPTYTYQTPSGEYCREYQQTIIVGGRERRGYGTACRQPDGSWQIVN